MRIRRLVGTAALAAVVGATSLLGAGTAAAADSTAPLPLTGGHGDIVVDGVHDRVFLSDPVGSAVVVTDYDGTLVKRIEGEPGAAGLALSEDSGTLFVALPDGDAISAVDTGTLTEKARYRLGAGNRPLSPAVTGDTVWFGYDAADSFGDVGSLDLSGPEPVVSLKQVGYGPFYSAPTLVSSPAAPGRIVATVEGSSPATLTVYDVSAGTPKQQASVRDPGGSTSNMQDMAITPDGEHVVTASGSPYYHQVFRLEDLSADGRYATNHYPNSVAVAPDGTVAAGISSWTPALSVFKPGRGTAYRTYDFQGTGTPDLRSAGLAWAPEGDRLFAVTEGTDNGGAAYALKVFTDATKAVSALTVTAPGTSAPHKPLTVSGELTARLAHPDGTTVEVTRAGPGGKRASLGEAAVAADGTFAVTDRPKGTGEAVYTVTYRGDGEHTAATATATVTLTR
ncbi:hypothetical protein [Streptomyces sp. CA-132043]|uniref:hypothetical protein n=1 Tax=Streptomyces sp. CA-132043 TaxID=3240048 RepID=UPI003D9106D9